MVTYDLNKSGQDYDGVIKAIKEAGDEAWCHYWDSAWLIRSAISSPNEVVDKIKPHLDSNDKLLVIEVKNNKQGWLTEKQWDYINNEIFG